MLDSLIFFFLWWWKHSKNENITSVISNKIVQLKCFECISFMHPQQIQHSFKELMTDLLSVNRRCILLGLKKNTVKRTSFRFLELHTNRWHVDFTILKKRSSKKKLLTYCTVRQPCICMQAFAGFLTFFTFLIGKEIFFLFIKKWHFIYIEKNYISVLISKNKQFMWLDTQVSSENKVYSYCSYT